MQKKFAVAEIELLIENCKDPKIQKLKEEGYTHMEITLDRDGKQMGDIGLFKDTSRDQELKSVLNRGNGIVVIEA